MRGGMRIITMAAAAITGLGVATTAVTAQEYAGRELRVVTFNIQHGYPADRKPCDATTSSCAGPDLDRIAERIRKLNPDVVSLQEVNRDHRFGNCVDMAAELGKKLGMDHRFHRNAYQHPTHKCGAGKNEDTGNAILSKFPITGTGKTDLPKDVPGQDKPRTLVWASFTVDGKPMVAYSLHISHLYQDARIPQLKAALASVAQVNKAHGNAMSVLSGDFNAAVDRADGDQGKITEGKQVVNLVTDAGFTDGWQAAPKHTSQPYTHKADNPTIRIDYVFAGPSFTVTQAGALNTRASDHRPVAVDLRVK
ncbi:endonuclease/exonuclease/phosphatase family protein [Amycolatopsis nigrescens]|uniref:endonuclease/exonuclease/phosphatase family protein n=1 Tax=Amycolatopsis nigrescens TaxID=381445 RepID=UPI00039B4F84|nr:endonuclease/exonuclease/phosphatase family protein [Amycolatopsis nigrescens]